MCEWLSVFGAVSLIHASSLHRIEMFCREAGWADSAIRTPFGVLVDISICYAESSAKKARSYVPMVTNLDGFSYRRDKAELKLMFILPLIFFMMVLHAYMGQCGDQNSSYAWFTRVMSQAARERIKWKGIGREKSMCQHGIQWKSLFSYI